MVTGFMRVYLLPCRKEVPVLITDELICSLWNLGFNRLRVSGGVQILLALKVDDRPWSLGTLTPHPEHSDFIPSGRSIICSLVCPERPPRSTLLCGAALM